MSKSKVGVPAVLAGLLLAAMVLAGCANTIRGVGADVKETGDAVGDAVE